MAFVVAQAPVSTQAAGSTGEVDIAKAVEAATTFLEALGVNLTLHPLRDTPARMARAYAELLTPQLFSVTTFERPSGYDGLVIVRHLRFVSICEHHALPFIGTAAVGYVPSERIVGLSKLARAVDMLSRGPQVQERVTARIAEWVQSQLRPEGVGVRIEAEHMCMSLRGVRTNGTKTVTSVLTGSVRDIKAIRDQWMAETSGFNGPHH
jgi:GTP cyclohydrolase IA